MCLAADAQLVLVLAQEIKDTCDHFPANWAGSVQPDLVLTQKGCHGSWKLRSGFLTAIIPKLLLNFPDPSRNGGVRRNPGSGNQVEQASAGKSQHIFRFLSGEKAYEFLLEFRQAAVLKLSCITFLLGMEAIAGRGRAYPRKRTPGAASRREFAPPHSPRPCDCRDCRPE